MTTIDSFVSILFLQLLGSVLCPCFETRPRETCDLCYKIQANKEHMDGAEVQRIPLLPVYTHTHTLKRTFDEVHWGLKPVYTKNDN